MNCSTDANSPRSFARKYRPKAMQDVRGQDVLLQTLKNSFETQNIAQAYMLSGVRGVGKTTTARLIARGVNCVGQDGQGSLTVTPCGICGPCKAILEERYIDVIEMDAASRTGVEDIRDIIEGVHYKPIKGRYKVYIIDEVHMLSKNAFNALLKTLEEPPLHCIFIFATTEIRKVPVTVLSRCQRFDLKRLSLQNLVDLFQEIAEKENLKVEQKALELVAYAAGGSARDGVSLLEQACQFAGDFLQVEHVQNLLGYSADAYYFTLLEYLLQGNVEEALVLVRNLYQKSMDPYIFIKDLACLLHALAIMKTAKVVEGRFVITQKENLEKWSARIDFPTLSLWWQVLQQGIKEIQLADMPQPSLEMLLLRLVHVHDLTCNISLQSKKEETRSLSEEKKKPYPQESLASSLEDAKISKLEDIVKICNENKEHLLASQIESYVCFIAIDAQKLTIALQEGAPKNIDSLLARKMTQWFGHQWQVIVKKSGGDSTIQEKKMKKTEQALETVCKDTTAKEVLNIFPGARVIEVKNKPYNQN